MKHPFIFSILCLSTCTLSAATRTWTAHDGRSIIGEIKKLNQNEITIQVNGTNFHFPLSRLIQEDQDFAQSWLKKQNSGDITLGTTTIPADGKRYTVDVPITETISPTLFKKRKSNQAFVKINIAIPQGFSPTKNPKCLWIAAPINNPQQAKDGNQAAFESYQSTALNKQYVVLCFDSPEGNPRGFEPNDDREFADAVVTILSQSWPDFRNWKHACAGFSGGSKVSFFRVAQLCANKTNVIGCFFAGCNQVSNEKALAESHPRKAQLKNVSGWVSNGTNDGIANPSHGENVIKSLNEFGYGKTKLVTFPGGHSMEASELSKALTWFEEEAATNKKP